MFLLLQLQHDIRNLDILLGLVLGGDFKDDVPLVSGDGLLANGLDKGGHPVEEDELAFCVSINRVKYRGILTSWEGGPCS